MQALPTPSGARAFGVNGTQLTQGFTSSFHPGGANVAFADGSVHFLSDDLAFDALIALSAMSDGQSVGTGFDPAKLESRPKLTSGLQAVFAVTEEGSREANFELTELEN